MTACSILVALPVDREDLSGVILVCGGRGLLTVTVHPHAPPHPNPLPPHPTTISPGHSPRQWRRPERCRPRVSWEPLVAGSGPSTCPASGAPAAMADLHKHGRTQLIYMMGDDTPAAMADLHTYGGTQLIYMTGNIHLQ